MPQMLLHSRKDLSHDEVLVDEDEEETLDKGIEGKKAVLGHRHEDLCDEVAEKLGLVQHMLVKLCHLLQHLNVGFAFRVSVLPEDLSDLGRVAERCPARGCAEADERRDTRWLRWCFLFHEREGKALLVEDVDELLGHLHQREDKRFLLSERAFEIVVFKSVPKLVSDECLPHQARHT